MLYTFQKRVRPYGHLFIWIFDVRDTEDETTYIDFIVNLLNAVARACKWTWPFWDADNITKIHFFIEKKNQLLQNHLMLEKLLMWKMWCYNHWAFLNLQVTDDDYYRGLSVSKDDDFELHLKTKTLSCFVNNYFSDGFKARQVNMDIQPVFNEYKVVTYMCSYFSKRETIAHKSWMKQLRRLLGTINKNRTMIAQIFLRNPILTGTLTD